MMRSATRRAATDQPRRERPRWSNRVLGPPEDRLPLFLLSTCNGLYFFFLNLVPFLGDGISEADEQRIFLSAWLTVPLLALASQVAIHRLRHVHFPGISSFYFLLLLTNVTFWAGFFAYTLFSAWADPRRLLTRDLVIWVVVALPLFNGIALLIAKRYGRRVSNASAHLQRLYLALPFLALVAMLNFSGILTAVTLPWPVLEEPPKVRTNPGWAADAGPRQRIPSYRNTYVQVVMRSLDAPSDRARFPWAMFEGATIENWQARAGDTLTHRTPMLTFSSQELSAVVKA